MKVIKYILSEDYYGYAEFLKGKSITDDIGMISQSGYFIIYKGFKWDGCTPKLKIFNGIIGTPDSGFNNINWRWVNDITKEASLRHDFFYMMQKKCKLFNREDVDKDFKNELNKVNFWLENTYYKAVVKYGERYWNK